MGEQRKAGSGDCSVMLSISSPCRSSWKEGGWREEREAASRRTITAGGSEGEEKRCENDGGMAYQWRTAAYTSTIKKGCCHSNTCTTDSHTPGVRP